MAISQAGAVAYLEQVTGRSVVCKLFSNDITPSIDDTASDYTEPAVMGLEGIILYSWGTIVGSPGRAERAHTTLTWNSESGSGVTLYGIFVIDQMSMELLLALRFPTPKVFTPGTPLQVDFKMIARDPAA